MAGYDSDEEYELKNLTIVEAVSRSLQNPDTMIESDSILYDNYEYIEKLYSLVTRLQNYCYNNALPIFNHPNTRQILVDAFVN